MFSQASPEAILYDASAAEKIHRATSTTREVVKKIQPFIKAVEQYGAALDVYANIYPLVMSSLWGSVRIVLQVRTLSCLDPERKRGIEDKERSKKSSWHENHTSTSRKLRICSTA